MIDQSPLYAQCDFAIPNASDQNRDAIRSGLAALRCPSDTAPEVVHAELAGHAAAIVATGNYVGCESFLSGLSSVRLGQVSDGLSMTLLIGERNFAPAKSGSLPFTSAWCGVITESDVYVFTSTPHIAVSGARPINRSASSPAHFSSRHPGGAFFARGDGSVSFVSENIDSHVLDALGTANGGEAVSY